MYICNILPNHYGLFPFFSFRLPQAGLDFESIPGHTSLVLFYQRLAVRLRGIIGFGKEHAVVASGFFFFADAAWLFTSVSYTTLLRMLLMGGAWANLGLFGKFRGRCWGVRGACSRD